MLIKSKLLQLSTFLAVFLFTGFAYGQVSLRVVDIPAAANGTTIGVVVKVGPASGVSSADIWLTYDNTKLSPTGTVSKGVQFGNFSIVSSTEAASEVRVAMAGSTPVNVGSESDLITVYFNVLTGSGSTTVDFSKNLLNGTNLTTTTQSGTVTFTALPAVNLSVQDYPNAAYQSVIGIPVKIGAYNDISSADIWLVYDPAKLQPTGTVNRGASFQAFSLSSSTANSGEVRVAMAGSSPVNITAASDLIVVYFKVLQASGTASIGFSKNLVNGGNFPTNVTSGTVSFVSQSTSFTLPIKVANPGETVSVDISAPSVTGVRGIDVWISYDPAVLAPASASLASELSAAGFSLQSNLSGAGLAKLALAVGTPATISGTVATIAFTVVGAGGQSTALGFNRLNINEGGIQATTQNGSVAINRAPVLSEIGNKSAVTGTPLTFSLQATDPDGDGIVFSATGLPTGATLNTETGEFSWTPSATGTFNITFKATDIHGIEDSETISVSVSQAHVNQAPVLSTEGVPTSTSVTVGGNVNYTFVATDPDSDPVSYQSSDLPAGASLNSGTGLFSWTPTAAGTASITFWATDGSLNSNTHTLTITVNAGAVPPPPPPPVNTPPVLNPIQNRSVAAGDVVSILAQATDANGDQLTYALSGNVLSAIPAPVFNTATGQFTWSTTAATIGGIYQATVTVSDGHGGVVSRSFTITVAGVNHPPVLGTLNNVTVNQGQVVSFTVTATDPDGDPLTLSASGAPLTATPAASFNAATGQFSWATSQAIQGNFTLTFTASDGKGGVATKSITVTVGSVNRPPVLNPIGGKTVVERETLEFNVSASDPDAGAQLLITTTPLPTGATFSYNVATHSGQFRFAPVLGQAGTYPVTFTVSDGQLAATETIQITVTQASVPPVIATIGNRTVNVGQRLAFQITATDPAGRSTVSLSLSGLPSGASFDPATGLFSFTPTQAGASTVTVTATGGGGATSTQTFTVTAVGVNRPPVFTPLAAQSVNTGAALQFTVQATDPDGDPVTLSATGSPLQSLGASFNPASGGFSWTPAAGTQGNYRVDFSAVDDKGGNSRMTLTITVGSVNRPPALSDVTNRQVNAGLPLIVTFTASDPDGNPLTLSTPVRPAGSVVTFSAGSGSFNWTPTSDQVGTHDVTLIVSDGSLTAEKKFTITVLKTNHPPTMAPLGNRTVSEGGRLDINVLASDPDNDPLLYFATGIPEGATFDASTGLFTFKPTYDQAGSYTVNFKVSDADGLSANQNVQIQVKDFNRPPVFGTLGNQTVEVGKLLEVMVSASDPDNDVLTFSARVPSGAAFDAQTRVLRWIPGAQDAGTRQATFSVSDGKGESVTRNISISVTTPNIVLNRPPLIDPVGAQVVEAGQSLSFSVSASDPEQSKVILTASGVPAGASFTSSTGAFKFTPTYLQAGSYSVTFTASDGQLTASLPVAITVVRSLNSAPVLSGVSNREVQAGQSLTFVVSASDPEGDQFTLGARNLPPGAVFNPGNGTFTYSPTMEQAGSYNVSFLATDFLGASSEKSMTLSVRAVNRPPEFVRSGNIAAAVGQLIELIVTANDPDGDPLVYSSSSAAALGAAFDTQSHILKWTPATPGTFGVNFKVEDGRGGSAVQTVLIAVSSPTVKLNLSPKFEPLQNYVLNAGGSLSFTVNASDPDGDNLVFGITKAPANASFNSTTRTFSFNPDLSQSGVFKPVFTVSDGKLTDQVSAEIEVKAVNRAPVLSGIPDRSVPEAGKLSFFVNAFDPDSDPLVRTADNLPENAGFNPQSGRFSFSPAVGQAGSYTVRFFAIDPKGASDTVTVSIQVLQVNLPPALGFLSNLEVTAGELAEIVLSASDPNDPLADLVFSASGLPQGAVFSAADRSFRWTPEVTQIGNFRVSFAVTDPAGLKDEKDIKITVKDPARFVDSPPVLASVGDRTVEEGSALSFTVTATDPDPGSTVTLTARNLPNGAAFSSAPGASSASGTFSFTPTMLQAGSYNVVFRASDGDFINEETVTITVTELDVAPVISVSPSQTAAVGQTLSIKVDGSDASGEPVVLSVQNSPMNSLFLTSAGRFAFTPSLEQAGQSFPVTFRVTDASGGYAEATCNISVSALNVAPELRRIPPLAISEGGLLEFSVVADDRNGDVLTYSAGNLPTGASFDAAVGIFRWMPAAGSAGNYSVSFSAADPAGLSDSRSVSITVGSVNRPPMLSDPGPQSAAEGQVLGFQVSASDPDGNPVTLSASGLPAGATFSDNGNGSGSFSWATTYRSNGSYQVVFSASDGSLSDQLRVPITIQDVNLPPTLDLAGGTLLAAAGMKFRHVEEGIRLAADVNDVQTFTVKEGEQVRVGIKVEDPGGDLLAVAVRNLPANASLGPDGMSILFAPDYDQAGDYLVLIEVSDGVFTVSRYAAFKVEDVNRPPVLRPVGERYVQEGMLISFEINAYDPDGDPITYAFSGLPGVATLVNNLFTFDTRLLPARQPVDAVYFLFRAFDGRGGSDWVGQDIAIIRPYTVGLGGTQLAAAVSPGDSIPLQMREGIGIQMALVNSGSGTYNTTGSIQVSEISGPLTEDVIKNLQGGGSSLLAVAASGGGKSKLTAAVTPIQLSAGGESGFFSIRRGWSVDLGGFSLTGQARPGVNDSIYLYLGFAFQDSDLVTQDPDLNGAFGTRMSIAAWDSVLGKFVLLEGVVDTLLNRVRLSIPLEVDTSRTALSAFGPIDLPRSVPRPRYKYFTAGAVLDYTPPSVEVQSKSFVTSRTEPYTILAKISDDLTGIARVDLIYTIAEQTDTVGMEQVSGVYQGEIPGQPIGANISYYVEAIDRDGNVSREPKVSGYLLNVSELGPTDLDGNGKVDVFDLLVLLRALTSHEDRDVNGDGKTDIWDLLVLLKVLSGKVQTALSGQPAGLEQMLNPSGKTAPEYKDDFGVRIDEAAQAAVARIVLEVSPEVGLGQVTVAPAAKGWQVVTSREGDRLTLLVFSLDGAPLAGGTLVNVDYLLGKGERLNESHVRLQEILVLNAEGQTLKAGVSLDGVAALPRAFSLEQNCPNPFNPSTSISFSLPEGPQVQVRLSVYNLRGQLLKVLVNETRDPGSYQVTWDGRDERGRAAPSGVYFYRMEAGDFARMRKMILLK
ncbi:Ig-like domain-containing protein [bacterium]|nr:Ig-like domain-containing protein [bacterium]